MQRRLEVIGVLAFVMFAHVAGAAAADDAKATGGLKLQLKLDAAKLREGQPWTGSVTATNMGKSVFTIDLRGGPDEQAPLSPLPDGPLRPAPQHRGSRARRRL